MLIRTVLLLLALLATSCGRNVSQDSTGDLDRLRKVKSTYLAFNRDQADDHGFILTDECDSLLFSSLNAIGSQHEIDIEAAQREVGHWFRRPLELPICGPDEISRDMLVGLLAYSVTFHRLDILEGLWDYAQGRDWRAGDGDTRTILTPSFIGMLARAIDGLGGISHQEKLIPDIYVYSPENQWYSNHLSMVKIYLESQVSGKITNLQLLFLKTLVADSPGNLLGQALLHKFTDGDQSQVIDKLLLLYPNERLPSSTDWCEEWRWQRKDGDSGFSACTGGSHSGGDFLFLATLILGQ